MHVFISYGIEEDYVVQINMRFLKIDISAIICEARLSI